jgi:putative sigma-54 modulation protein
MRIIITGKNINVSEALETRVNRKIGKLSRFFGPDTDAQVKLEIDKLRNICEVTIPIKGGLIRAEHAADNNMFAAIDEVSDKLESQIRRYRTRLEKRHKSPSLALNDTAAQDMPAIEDEEVQGTIVREKTFDVYPMNPEEATAQMDMLGHTFFLFLNTETDSVCAVYKRHDGNYGLLVPKM